MWEQFTMATVCLNLRYVRIKMNYESGGKMDKVKTTEKKDSLIL